MRLSFASLPQRDCDKNILFLSLSVLGVEIKTKIRYNIWRLISGGKSAVALDVAMAEVVPILPTGTNLCYNIRT